MSQAPDFDSIKQVNPYGEDYWSARALMPLLGYGKNWQNFTTAIQKAMISCRENGQIVEYHFNASIKMVPIGSGAERPLDDYNLSRLPSYPTPLTPTPRNPQIPPPQTPFPL